MAKNTDDLQENIRDQMLNFTELLVPLPSAL